MSSSIFKNFFETLTAQEGVRQYLLLVFRKTFTTLDLREIVFVEREGCETGFSNHYQKYIAPHILEFEQRRQKILQQVQFRMRVALPLAAAILAAAAYHIHFLATVDERVSRAHGDTIAFISWGTFFALTIMGIFGSFPVMRYKSDIKDKIFPAIFKFFGDFRYQQDSPLKIESLDSFGIIPPHSAEDTEDYVKGAYKEVGIEMSETTLRAGSKKTDFVFVGMVILLDIHKYFEGKTIITKDAGIIGDWFKDRTSKLEKVNLEDPVFEKKFAVHSSDQVEARYLLTTSFMERLLEISRLFGGANLQASFYNKKLLLMIPVEQNLFEPSSIFHTATFVEDIRTLLKQMHLIFQIIDILKLDQKTGL